MQLAQSRRESASGPTLLQDRPNRSAKDSKAHEKRFELEADAGVPFQGRSSGSAKCEEPWERELLEVSAELKRKLDDPHFVAMRCDLDGSGDLDLHELKQAAQVFGMRFESKKSEDITKLRGLMAGKQRISKERFGELVKEFQGSPGFVKEFQPVQRTFDQQS